MIALLRMSVLRIAHYRVLNFLGSGGRGEVYVAEDTRLKRKVALKLVRHDARESCEETFQEAHFAAMVNHPNTASVYDIGEHDGICFIASEWVEGDTLRQRLEHGPLPILEALDICIAVGTALNAVHEVWIVHRDVKPENIIIRRDHHVKLIDFSVARLITQSVPVDPIRERRELVGTLGYLSPEQVRGDLVDQRSDLFCLGVVLYEMLTGERPFHAPTDVEVLAGIVEGDVPPLPPYFPRSLSTIIEKALRKPVHERYQTADELVADLRELREHLRQQLRIA